MVALVACALLVSVLLPVAAGPVRAQESQCSNAVTYDQFRFNNETVAAAANGTATATAKNTEVRVEQAPGFVRVQGTNPNGYCIQFRVRLNASIVSPAELGEITANEGNISAEWHAVRDFERDVTYTEVVFTLPAGSKATFAPSEVRVKSLAWTGDAKSAGGSLWDSLSDFSIGDPPTLEQRTYRFNATSDTDTITVNLKNGSTGQEVEEWQAMYRTANQTGWTPVSTDSESAVFYRRIDAHQIQFVFNDATGEVRFTANPSVLDKADHSWDAWWSGQDVITERFKALFE